MPRVTHLTPSGSDADKYLDFFAEELTVQDVAAQQGVTRVRNLDDLRGKFWPAGDEVDDFVAAVRQWRHDGG